ncbi:MAG: glutamate--tRNA ligase family protein, partial [Phycisphaerales bacterium]
MAHVPACSRIAPSPTGPLHLGNACTFLVNWALARRHGWRLVLRIEDLDRERTRAAGDADVEDLLGWLGIDHDGPVVRHRPEGYSRF